MDSREAYKKTNEIADLGADVTAFKAGNIGKFLIKRAKEDEITALKKLSNVCPTDTDGIRQLQLEAKVPAAFLNWLEKAIDDGAEAKWELSQDIEVF